MQLKATPRILLTLLTTPYLIPTTAAARNTLDAFDPIATGCCPDSPEFPKATAHPNATGTFPIPGLYLEDSALTASIKNDTNNPAPPAPKNWTWSTNVMEVPLEKGDNMFATNQIFTLDIPTDVDIYNPDHERNVCVLLLEMANVNRNDQGDCSHLFSRKQIGGMREELVRRVEAMTGRKGEASPCAGMGDDTLWQDIISPYHRESTTLHARNSSIAAQYHTSTSTSSPHPANDTSTYDAALVRTQPILLLGYSVDPKVLAGPAVVKRDLVETRLTCVRVMKVDEGSRGETSGAGSLVGSAGGWKGLGMIAVGVWLASGLGLLGTEEVVL
ncbi:hypothetical protein AJ79_04265 [Helicocarpus griseus UAMH5409]|uniref:Uncharacterized protein n=1 Tax=Helicocarpus griseus UAMH5409 TaxID=1447875 RepID=A0A2B7XTZ4_9EURO|nr:hypothetical protein AJ79_04265 [Helicocarpus griseus UAMH5409]